MQYRPLGKTGLQVSSIALGCVTFGREIDAHTSFAILDRAVEHGINLLDTAAVYGDGASEELIGRWLQHRRPEIPVMVASKVSGRLTPQNIIHSVDGSLRRLALQRIDLLQAHDWDPESPLEPILETFHNLIQAGKVRHVGCSNWPTDQLRQALALAHQHDWHRLESVQPMYNLANRQIERDLLPFCSTQQIGVITYSPLGAGFLTGKYRPDEPAPQGTRFDIKPGHQRIYFNPCRFQIVDDLRQLAQRTGHSMVRLALGWVLHQPGPTAVLIGARHPGHLDQALEAANSPLDPSILHQLDQLSQPAADTA